MIVSTKKQGPVALSFSRRTFLSSAAGFLAFQASQLRASPLLHRLFPASPLLSPSCLATARTAYPPMLAKFIAQLDPASDTFPIEIYCAQIQKVLDEWTASLCSSTANLDVVKGHISEDIHASPFNPAHTTQVRVDRPLLIERRDFASPQRIARDSFLHSLANYLQPWPFLATAELEIYGLHVEAETPLRIVTDIRYDLVGTTRDSLREQRVGACHLTWVFTSQHLIVDKWMIDSEVRSRLSGSGFAEITSRCLPAGTPGMAQLTAGIDDWRTAIDGSSGIDVYGNHGIAAGDIDGSGCDSFYVCQPSGLPNRLYRNRGDGTFDDITEKSGTGLLDGTASALFADFQNRGSQDLLVIRSTGPLLFANLGDGRFEPRPNAFHFANPPQGTFTSAAIADYNCDGLLDIYFCVYSYYQGLNQYAFPSPYYDAQNGPPNFLFRNRGDGTFEDVTATSGMNQNNNRFSFAAAWCDYDNDGYSDLYVANDFGRKNLYRNRGDGTFHDIAEEAGVEDYGPGMSACWLDYDNDGAQDVYVANMWLPEGKRITADDHFLPGVDPAIRQIYQKHNAGNSMYRNISKGKFENRTEPAGTAMGRWSWSCASWDFDHDGWPDLYVANGFVSGPNKVDLQSFFWRQVAQRSMTLNGASSEYELAWNAINELVRSDYSWSGYQRNVFFANNRDGSFSDISGVLGLDLIDDSRAYSLSDFDGDGRLEFVLKNRTGPQVRILRNDLDKVGNSITLRLTGTASNRDAIGAVVTIESRALKQSKFISAGSGFASQHSKELHFGLGDSTHPIAISVRWPNGKLASYEALPVNHRVSLVEGDTAVKAVPYRESQFRNVPADRPAAPLVPKTISTWLISPLFGPDLQLIDLKGEMRRLSDLKGQPALLVFVRAGCEGSRSQLELLQNHVATFSAAGLSLFVVALASPEERAAVDNLAQRTNATFPIHLADERAAGAWNIQYRYLFDRRRDMSLPICFLLDAEGGCVRVYQGVAAPPDVLLDVHSMPRTDAQRLTRALPFPGPYYGGSLQHNYLTYGIAFLEYGFVDEAQAAFERAIQAQPDHEIGWFNLGTIFLNKKMFPEARQHLAEAVRLNPQDSDAWNNLGMISGEEQKYDEALDQFRRSALANPNNQLALENMMRIYQFQNRPEQAQKTLDDLIARAPENASLHLGLAMTLLAQNKLQGARTELETSLRLQPENPDAINNLGAVLLRMGQTDNALAQFEEGRRIAPDFDRPCINAALVYSSMGQKPRARQLLQEFLARHPENADVRAALDKLDGPL